MGLRHSLLNRQVKGFSLLELIIVLVIIGVMVAAISMSITDTRHDKLRLEARRLAARLSLALDEAILTNQELGLEVESDRYRFLYLDDERWQIIDSGEEKQLIDQQLPEGMEIQLTVDGLFTQFEQQNELNKLFREDESLSSGANEEEDAAVALRPQIYLMSSGELNPFILVIGYDDDNPLYYQLAATFDGNITIEGPFQESLNFAINRAIGKNDE